MVAAGIAQAATKGGSSIVQTAAKGVAESPKRVAQGIIGDLISGLDKGLKAAILPIVLPITLIVKSIGALLDGVESALEPVLKVISAIGKMIGLFIMPFVNLIIPLLIPILQILKPFVVFANAVLKVLFKSLMDAMKGVAVPAKAIMDALKTGDFAAAQQLAIDYLKNVYTAMAGVLQPAITSFAKVIVDFVNGFLTLDMEGVKKALEEYLGKDLGDAVFAFVDIIYKGISAVAGFIAQLVGKDNFDKMFGSGQFENIKKTNEGFAVGVDLGTAFQQLIKAAWDFGKILIDFVIPAEEGGVSPLQELINQIGAVTSTIKDKGLPALLGSIATEATKWLTDVFTPFYDKITKEVLPQLNEWLTENVISNFKNALVSLTNIVDAWVTAFNNNDILKGLGGLFGVKQPTLNTTPKLAPNAFSSILKQQDNTGVMESLNTNVKDVSDSLISNNLKDAIKNASIEFNSLQGNIMSTSTAIREKIIGAKAIETLASNMHDVGGDFNVWHTKMSKFDPVSYFKKALEAEAKKIAGSSESKDDNLATASRMGYFQKGY